MIENEVARKYGQAVFELAQDKGELEQVAEDLKMLRETISEVRDFKNLLYHPRINDEKKKEVFLDIVGDEISDITRDFCQLLIDKRRIRFLHHIVRDFEKRHNQAEKILEVELSSAIELPEELENRIRARLSDITGYNIELETEVDEDIIGGFQIKVGDRIIDGSIQGELEKIQKQLEQIPVSKLGVE